MNIVISRVLFGHQRVNMTVLIFRPRFRKTHKPIAVPPLSPQPIFCHHPHSLCCYSSSKGKTVKYFSTYHISKKDESAGDVYKVPPALFPPPLLLDSSCMTPIIFFEANLTCNGPYPNGGGDSQQPFSSHSSL